MFWLCVVRKFINGIILYFAACCFFFNAAVYFWGLFMLIQRSVNCIHSAILLSKTQFICSLLLNCYFFLITFFFKDYKVLQKAFFFKLAYFWLSWVFVAAAGFSSCELGLLSLRVSMRVLLIAVVSLAADHRLQGAWASVIAAYGLSSCSLRV